MNFAGIILTYRYMEHVIEKQMQFSEGTKLDLSIVYRLVKLFLILLKKTLCYLVT